MGFQLEAPKQLTLSENRGQSICDWETSLPDSATLPVCLPYTTLHSSQAPVICTGEISTCFH